MTTTDADKSEVGEEEEEEEWGRWRRGGGREERKLRALAHQG
jgi:hypothetical protein